MIRSDQVSVGIVSAGMCLPERVVTAAEIADESGTED
jgi:3-oxoacyl-[acyl-carrier-protein] synthase III